MPIDFTQSEEIMDALQRALVVAAAKAQIFPQRRLAPEDDWLTGPEAREFLRLKETAFANFCERYHATLVLTYAVHDRQPRYQLASLQAIMRAGAVGLPEPAPAVPAHVERTGRGRFHQTTLAPIR